MKRPYYMGTYINVIVCAIFFLTAITCSAGWVEITEGSTIRQVKLILDDRTSILPVSAIIKGSCLMVPATLVADILDSSMQYDPSTECLTYSLPSGGLEVLLYRKEWTFFSGERHAFSESPIFDSGIPFVPLELLEVTGDYRVSWDPKIMEIRLERPDKAVRPDRPEIEIYPDKSKDEPGVLTQIRHGVHFDKVRVVLHFTKEVPFKVIQMKTPPRVVLEFENTQVEDLPDCLINHIAVNKTRVSGAGPGNARVVMDFNYALPDVTTFWLQDPVRFVVDIPTIYSQKSALTIARGIRYITLNNGTANGPLIVDVLEIEMSDDNITVKTALAGPDGGFGLAPVSKLVSDSKAIAGINGVFYASDGTPLGLIIVDGYLKSRPLMNRTAMGITRGGNILIDNVSMDESGNLVPNWLEQGVIYAVGGGPRLVKGGRINVTSIEERFKADIACGRAPRTAVGVTHDGKLLLVSVTGRQAYHSVGVTLEELAGIMIELGAKDAMNFDGGGSSTMVVRDFIMNTPSDGKERKVADAILVFASER